MRPVVLLRPEPGAGESAAKAVAMGLTAVREPLFELVRVPWRVPDAGQFDALLMTSANAARFGGPGLERLHALPVHAVGAATAKAARATGFSVASEGGAGVDVLLAGLPRGVRLLHLAGAHRRAPQAHGAHIVALTVYRSAATDPSPGFADRMDGTVVAVHSRRAGERLAELITNRRATVVVAISAEVAAAVGAGWERVVVAARPSDAALLALAAELCLEGDR